jgi:hypothetical protein
MTTSLGSTKLRGGVHMPASNVIEGDEHLQHAAHARFCACGCHCMAIGAIAVAIFALGPVILAMTSAA